MESETPILTFSEFLSDTPPHTPVTVNDHSCQTSYVSYELNAPTINIHCDTDNCRDKGLLTFRCVEAKKNDFKNFHKIADYRYLCSNCRATEKFFSLIYAHDKDQFGGEITTVCIKVGEYPNYGAPVPARLIKIIGPDRELFLKGRRCENQGLGVGAFSYYRRVIENQRDRLFDQIIKITQTIEPGSLLIHELESAKNETQFTKSVDAIKTALPQTLLINGHNPLTLLHGALSQGLHAGSDEECLELASMIRTVLTEFAKKVAAATNENKELVDAVTRLNQLKGRTK